MAYNESILHSVGRAVGSGAWQGIGARAVQAFQNAQRIAMARKGMEQDEAFRQKQFAADQDYRTNVTGPTALQNAQSRGIDARAHELGARTRALDLHDELSGGKVNRGVLQSQASKAPLSTVPDLLSIPPSEITGPGAIDAFKRAQEAEYRKAVREHAAKQSINKKTDIETHASKDLLERLNELLIGPKKQAGLPGDEFDRRQQIQQRNMILRKYADKLLAEDPDMTADELTARLEALGQSLGAAE